MGESPDKNNEPSDTTQPQSNQSAVAPGTSNLNATGDRPQNAEAIGPGMTGGSGASGESVDQAHDDRYPDDTISLLDLLLVIATRWRLIFFATFFAAIGIVLFSIYTIRMPSDSPYNPLPNYYRPEAQVLLRDPDSGGVSGSLGSGELGILAGLVGGGSGQGESSAALAQKLLGGNFLVDEVIREFDLLKDYADADSPLDAARKSLRAALGSEFDPDSGIMTISFESIDKIFATDVLVRYVELLETRFTSLTRNTARAKSDAIGFQLQRLEDELTVARDAFTAFQRQHGVIDPATQGAQTMSMIASNLSEIINLEVQRETLLQLVQNEDDPQVKRIERQIALIQEFVDELDTGFRKYSPVTIPRNQIAELTVRYEDLKRDLLLKESVFTSFQAELLRAQIESQDVTRRFQVIEPPEVPGIKAGPSRGMISIIVAITAFFLAVFLAFILEYFSRARTDPSESYKMDLIRDQFRFRKNRDR